MNKERTLKGKKVLKIVLFSLLGVVAALVIVLVLTLRKEWNRTTYFENTKINGINVSDKTPAEILTVLAADYSTPSVHVTEGDSDTEEAVFTLPQLGYEVDKDQLLDYLNIALQKQKSSISVLMDSMMNGNAFRVTIPFTSDEAKLEAAVTVSALKDARVDNQDAELVYDEVSKTYSITPAVQGTHLEDASLQKLVKESADSMVADVSAGIEDTTVKITPDLYIKPDINSDDPVLNMKMNTYNAYDKAVITYDFGDQTQVLDWNTIRDWVFFDEGQGYLSEDSIRTYVNQLAANYNTIYYTRTFTTTGGQTLTFSDSQNGYGYLVDEDGEYQQLLSDIQSNTQVEREPVYTYSGIGRSGRNDMLEYVEIDITKQHLWFYKNGSLVVESDVVTGNVAKKTETATGIYPVAYKESPAKLIPSNEKNGTDVKYWMPFYDGQGLHDASWRSAFGGNIYQTNGSHGCVNLPPAVAATIFENLDTGCPVVLYKEG